MRTTGRRDGQGAFVECDERSGCARPGLRRARGRLRKAAPFAGLAVLWSALSGGCGDGSDATKTGVAEKGGTTGIGPVAADADRRTPEFTRLFVETTSRAGLKFRHDAGSRGAKLLPETMGAAPVVFDFDGDSFPDVYLPNGGPEVRASSRPAGPGGKLFRNRGDGGFDDVTEKSGTALPHVYAMGGSAADFDGDGDEDLFVTALGDDVLLRNDGGVFVDVTATAGVGGGRWTDAAGVAHPEWSTASAWFDADADGDVDLFVAKYVAWTPETEIFTSLDGVTKSFTTPDRYPGLPCRLFLNDGDGTFTDGSAAAGLLPHLGKALGVAIWDFDGDGLLDVVVANDTRPNFLFMNRGGGVFSEDGLVERVAYDENGRARAGMGVDVADDLGDVATPVIAIGNFAAEPISFYRRGRAGGFTPTAAEAGLAGPTFAPLTFGLHFLDADLDGRLDLALANGHLEPDIGASQAGRTYAQAPMLFRGRGRTYDDVSNAAGADFARPRVGRGLVVADFDRDGDPDLLLTANGVVPDSGSAVLFENRPKEPGAKPPHWLRVELRGSAPNTRAIGARVELECGGRTAVRYVRTGSSYAGQSELPLLFGLGANEAVTALKVAFPRRGGAAPSVRTIPVPGVDRTIVVVE